MAMVMGQVPRISMRLDQVAQSTRVSRSFSARRAVRSSGKACMWPRSTMTSSGSGLRSVTHQARARFICASVGGTQPPALRISEMTARSVSNASSGASP